MAGDTLKSLQLDVLSCEKCRLHKVARERVFGEGDIPADVLFIGEGPGITEDLMGRPFVGRAGREILRPIVKELAITAYYLNLVCCHPTDKIAGQNRKPKDDEVMACMDRLMRQVEIVHPKCIIVLGREPERHLKDVFPGAAFAYHPAYVLRNRMALLTMHRQIVEAINDKV